MPYTDGENAELMIVFNHAFSEFIDIKPKDFIVSGSDGALVEACTPAMPGNPKNIAYKLSLSHGEPNGHDEMIEATTSLSITIS